MKKAFLAFVAVLLVVASANAQSKNRNENIRYDKDSVAIDWYMLYTTDGKTIETQPNRSPLARQKCGKVIRFQQWDRLVGTVSITLIMKRKIKRNPRHEVIMYTLTKSQGSDALILNYAVNTK